MRPFSLVFNHCAKSLTCYLANELSTMRYQSLPFLFRKSFVCTRCIFCKDPTFWTVYLLTLLFWWLHFCITQAQILLKILIKKYQDCQIAMYSLYCQETEDCQEDKEEKTCDPDSLHSNLIKYSEPKQKGGART